MRYSFDSDVAVKVGVPGAVILNNLFYWIKHNEANETNFHDGTYWTYNSVKAFCELMPFWSKNTLNRTLTKLEKEGYIKTGNYNKSAYNRTKWYALTDKGYTLLGGSISEKSKIDLPKSRNEFDQKQKTTIDNQIHNREHNTKPSSDPFSNLAPELVSSLKDFTEMRKKIHAPLTDRAKVLLLKKLEDLAPNDVRTQCAIVDQSTLNSWRGVFPLKKDYSKQKSGEGGTGIPQFDMAARAMQMMKEQAAKEESRPKTKEELENERYYEEWLKQNPI